ncbi:MAG: HAD hydrolase-like protein [Bacillota bacterium]|nr:HAD hydrolase-like protein [Bacillota bacterium]
MKTTKPIRAVLFDLDGTVTDTIPHIVASYEHAFASLGIPSPGEAVILAGIGLTLDVYVPEVLPNRGADGLTEAFIRHYRAYNEASMSESIAVFVPAWKLLEALSAHGVPLGIVTSKARRGLGRTLEPFGLEDFFQILISSDDSARHKPDPEPLRVAWRALDRRFQELGEPALEPTELIYIGDAVHDVECAQNFGCPAAVVEWTRMPREELAALDPDLWIRDVNDLEGWLTG